MVMVMGSAARLCTGTPTGTPIPGITRDMLLRPASSCEGDDISSSSSSSASTAPVLLNTCSSDALAELLRTLKRAFWPFSWECRCGRVCVCVLCMQKHSEHTHALAAEYLKRTGYQCTTACGPQKALGLQENPGKCV